MVSTPPITTTDRHITHSPISSFGQLVCFIDHHNDPQLLRANILRPVLHSDERTMLRISSFFQQVPFSTWRCSRWCAPSAWVQNVSVCSTVSRRWWSEWDSNSGETRRAKTARSKTGIDARISTSTKTCCPTRYVSCQNLDSAFYRTSIDTHVIAALFILKLAHLASALWALEDLDSL